MPNVAFVHPEIRNLVSRWDIVKDCLSGQEQIKRMGLRYLPQPDPTNDTPENKERYAQYKDRAVFYNVTARTLKGLVGHVFSKDPVVTIPSELDLMKEDCDGSGVKLDQQSSKALAYTLAFGRGGLLVDYPTTQEPVSVADKETGNVRPTITLIDPKEIINWRVAMVGARKLLTLVVIAEQAGINDDGFETKTEQCWRVLRLVDGVYQVEIWKEQLDAKGNAYPERKFGIDTTYTPTDGSGKPWDQIPFQFFGSENNDSSCDLPPMYDLAVLNIAHYRNSADYEESVYMLGQPTPWLSGLTEDWVSTQLGGKVKLGSRAIIPLPENGQAGLLQAEPNSMAKEAMEGKERQMVALGAKLVEQTSVQRTATEAGQEEASETSVLAKAAKNVSAAYTQALKWAAMFEGIDIGAQGEDGDDEAISYELTGKFENLVIDAQTAAAIIAAWQGNAIATEEMRNLLARGDWAYLDQEKYQEALDTAGPGLGVPVHQEKIDQATTAAEAKAAALKSKQTPPPP